MVFPQASPSSRLWNSKAQKAQWEVSLPVPQFTLQPPSCLLGLPGTPCKEAGLGTTSGGRIEKGHLHGHLAMPSPSPLFPVGLGTAPGGDWGCDQAVRLAALQKAGRGGVSGGPGHRVQPTSACLGAHPLQLPQHRPQRWEERRARVGSQRCILFRPACLRGAAALLPGLYHLCPACATSLGKLVSPGTSQGWP